MPEIFMQVIDPDSNVGVHPVVTLTDGVTETVYHQFMAPSTMVSVTNVKAIIIASGTGNMFISVAANFGACAQLYNQHTDSLASTQYAATMNNFTCIDITGTVTGLAANDLVGVSITRYGGNALDTVNANCYYAGLIITYAEV